jgi:hypothetical protein
MLGLFDPLAGASLSTGWLTPTLFHAFGSAVYQ